MPYPLRCKDARSEIQGFAGLPIVLILSVLLGAIALGLGLRGLERTEQLIDEQRSVQSFNRLVEASTELSYGSMGGERLVRLELSERRIEVEGNLIRLKSNDGTKEVETLPLTLREGCEDTFAMESGVFLLKLEREHSCLGSTGNRTIIRVRRVD